MLSLSYLSDVKMNTRKKYHAFTCQVLAEIVNRILYQKNRTVWSNIISDSWQPLPLSRNFTETCTRYLDTVSISCARLPRYRANESWHVVCWSQLVSSGRCSWKRLHAFFHLHCVHHMARFSMPYTLRHFLTSVRDLRWPDDVDFSMKWLLVDCSSCESNECGSYSIHKHHGSVDNSQLDPTRQSFSSSSSQKRTSGYIIICWLDTCRLAAPDLRDGLQVQWTLVQEQTHLCDPFFLQSWLEAVHRLCIYSDIIQQIPSWHHPMWE